MNNSRYRSQHRKQGGRRRVLFTLAAILLTIAAGLGIYAAFFKDSPEERAANQLQFDASVSDAEQQTIKQAVQDQAKTYDGDVTVSVQTVTQTTDAGAVLSALLPVADVYDTRQTISKGELGSVDIYVSADMDTTLRSALATSLGLNADALHDMPVTGGVPDGAVGFILPSELSTEFKLLAFEGGYYLDTFMSGAVFRQATFGGSGASGLAGLTLNSNPGKETTLKVNMSGVTALTRVMIRKLASVPDASYFSEKIGDFMADADITHVSNEVSFKEGCAYHSASFCSPPEMIEALKDSGVDVVEITGNHNNDVGNSYNTQSINLYHSLGWGTFGGGLNTAEAAKPFLADKKGSKVSFLGYNQADGAGSGAIATASSAGANLYNAEKARTDIATAKQQGHFVIVDVQYSECFAYPGGYTEMPLCDQPIAGQKASFRNLIDMGADMVIGSSAHQPQTYELYKGKPIYYGLGNMYFEQTQQPGTERGIILTHYFVSGKLVQTKLSPTVYDAALQTHLMDAEGTAYLLKRLKTAREAADL